jgi:hypothetical protein
MLQQSTLRSGVEDYVIFLTTLYDISSGDFHTLVIPSDQNLCWIWTSVKNCWICHQRPLMLSWNGLAHVH